MQHLQSNFPTRTFVARASTSPWCRVIYVWGVCAWFMVPAQRGWGIHHRSILRLVFFSFSLFKKLNKINQGIKKCNLPASQIFHSDLNKSNRYSERAKTKNNCCIGEHCSESEATNRIALGLDSFLWIQATQEQLQGISSSREFSSWKYIKHQLFKITAGYLQLYKNTTASHTVSGPRMGQAQLEKEDTRRWQHCASCSKSTDDHNSAAEEC